MAAPPLWSLGYHQCRWFDYTADAVEQIAQRHRELDVPCDALWLDIEYMDGYRVFTWNADRFPDPRALLERLAALGFRVITIIDPGVKFDPGYDGLRLRARAGRLLPDRGRGRLPRTGLAGQHRVPRLRHRGRADLVGRAQRGAREVRTRGHLERHERAGHRRHLAHGDALRPRRVRSRALSQPVRPADGHGDHGRAARGDAEAAHVRAVPRRLSPGSSGTPRTGWATTWPAGTTCG